MLGFHGPQFCATEPQADAEVGKLGLTARLARLTTDDDQDARLNRAPAPRGPEFTHFFVREALDHARDRSSLGHKLAIGAAILVLLLVFLWAGWWICEGLKN